MLNWLWVHWQPESSPDWWEKLFLPWSARFRLLKEKRMERSEHSTEPWRALTTPWLSPGAFCLFFFTIFYSQPKRKSHLWCEILSCKTHSWQRGALWAQAAQDLGCRCDCWLLLSSLITHLWTPRLSRRILEGFPKCDTELAAHFLLPGVWCIQHWGNLEGR